MDETTVSGRCGRYQPADLQFIDSKTRRYKNFSTTCSKAFLSEKKTTKELEGIENDFHTYSVEWDSIR